MQSAIVVLLALLAGCADTRYYAQSVAGQVQLMWAARPVEDWLADPATPEPLQQRLRQAQDMRRFAVTELHLPDNASYHRYADLQRRHAVWNVVAAPEFSLTLKTWCFPVAGCVGYRGYFSEADAQAQAAQLRAQGLEASVYGVPAYSTLGWLNWLGGDPLLNTFIHYPEGEVARLVFHELSHQVVYVPDDTVFNESFATAVERVGGADWLQKKATPQARLAYAVFETRRAQFRALTRSTRFRLLQVYKENRALALDNKGQVAMKKEVLNDFRQTYQTLKSTWGGYPGYDAWVAQANNAAFGAQAAYDELVPGFEALFERQGRDWARFYDAVRQLATHPKDERVRQLKQWTSQSQG
ncbi:MAG: aminopeptidase [Comamonadaceae bacterium CG_4_9_14_0_8_um_filter_57_21]|nr:MAG: aminopeptidase [Comamonadaceae bacterium CG_4_10_14_0_8_um_filter_57_29]PJC23045.1 MAG: aminopeptidase [Comamonadaceae bacterium CG_4_9_14_0_8_um_filter_57_21]